MHGTAAYVGTRGVCPAKLTARQEAEIKKSALAAFHLIGCRDYARVDFRLTPEGVPYVLEVNPNPDISATAGFARSARTAGYSYPDTRRRDRQLGTGAMEPAVITGTIRPLLRTDREPLLRLRRATGVFTDDEIAIALELIDIVLDRPDQKDYEIAVYDDGEGPVGYTCIGPTPGTEGTYDLYWIAVDPALHGRGIGRELDLHVERSVSAEERTSHRCGDVIDTTLRCNTDVLPHAGAIPSSLASRTTIVRAMTSWSTANILSHNRECDRHAWNSGRRCCGRVWTAQRISSRGSDSTRNSPTG